MDQWTSKLGKDDKAIRDGVRKFSGHTHLLAKLCDIYGHDSESEATENSGIAKKLDKELERSFADDTANPDWYVNKSH